jgi:hypothetical protein
MTKIQCHVGDREYESVVRFSGDMQSAKCMSQIR